MYMYTVEMMPGCKAKFEGDTSIKYKIRRKYTPTSAQQKSLNDVIRTDLDYSEATAMAERFNGKEREAQAIKREEAMRLRLKA